MDNNSHWRLTVRVAWLRSTEPRRSPSEQFPRFFFKEVRFDCQLTHVALKVHNMLSLLNNFLFGIRWSIPEHFRRSFQELGFPPTDEDRTDLMLGSQLVDRMLFPQ